MPSSLSGCKMLFSNFSRVPATSPQNHSLTKSPLLNLLAIGNSFSEDATRYLHDVARADGESIHAVNLYIGSCSLERHYKNMLHASLGLGRFALGLLWYRVLTGKSVSNNPFCDFDEAVSEEDIRAVRAIVDSF